MSAEPWLQSYPEEVPASLEPYPEAGLYSLLESAARRFSRRTALVFFGKRISYARLLHEAERLAAVLSDLGVEQGERVGLVLPNCPQYVIAHFAVTRLGGIVVGNNPLYTEEELSRQIADSGARVLIALDRFHEKLGSARKEAGVREVLVTRITDYMPFPSNVLAPIRFRKEAKSKGETWPPVPREARVKSWKSEMRRAARADAPSVARVDPRADPAAFVYTGGTTGVSKGAMLSHRNLIANATQCAVWCDVKDGEETILCVLPFFHSYGMTTQLDLGVLRAATLVLLPRFDLEMVLKAIDREKPTLFPGVPRLYQTIADSPDARHFDLSSIRACVSGAGALPGAVAEKFRGLSGATVVEGYGLTEASPVTHANPLDGRAHIGAIGLPLPDTECRLFAVGEPAREVGPGEEGELVVRGPQVMLGYWNHLEETASALRDGWLHTGDIAVMEEDGFFRIVDRIKDMVKVSGFNVFPTEVEEVLHRHPKVLKVAVVGVPDGKGGDVLKAYVVLRPGAKAAPGEFMEFARERLVHYRVPKQIEFRDSLPETMIGKVLRRVLLEEERAKASSR